MPKERHKNSLAGVNYFLAPALIVCSHPRDNISKKIARIRASLHNKNKLPQLTT